MATDQASSFPQFNDKFYEPTTLDWVAAPLYAKPTSDLTKKIAEHALPIDLLVGFELTQGQAEEAIANAVKQKPEPKRKGRPAKKKMQDETLIKEM